MGQLSTSAGALATAASSRQAMTRLRVCFQTCQAMAGVRSHVRRSVALTEDYERHCSRRLNSRVINACITLFQESYPM